MSVHQVEVQRKLVLFLINDEFFAVDVNEIKEVFVPESITPIPQAKNYVAGVINYRGQVITTVDLKKRLKIEQRTEMSQQNMEDSRKYILIIEYNKSIIGLLVDYVEAVIGINPSQIQSDTEAISHGPASEFIQGIGNTEQGLIIILKLQSIFDEEEFSQIDMAKTESSKSESSSFKINFSDLSKNELLKIAEEMGTTSVTPNMKKVEILKLLENSM